VQRSELAPQEHHVENFLALHDSSKNLKAKISCKFSETVASFARAAQFSSGKPKLAEMFCKTKKVRSIFAPLACCSSLLFAHL
jgi:hypothetical protein